MMKDIKCFLEAFALLVASYFIFNIEYPTMAGYTLEFFQRYNGVITLCFDIHR